MGIAALDHVLVLTDDLERSRAFYFDALGLEVCGRPPLPFPGYWLGVDGRVCLHLADRTAYDDALAALGLDRPEGPVDHVSFLGAGHDALVDASSHGRRRARRQRGTRCVSPALRHRPERRAARGERAP